QHQSGRAAQELCAGDPADHRARVLAAAAHLRHDLRVFTPAELQAASGRDSALLPVELEAIMTYSLMTVPLDGRAIGCIERDGSLYRLTDVGAPDAVAALFEDWPRWSAHLATAKAGAGALPADLPVLAPLLYPGKILCAGANYYDHSAEMG